ncbi:MAG: biotin/lipoyl-binding protein, partial [Pyrinomonadaceae bacterium]
MSFSYLARRVRAAALVGCVAAIALFSMACGRSESRANTTKESTTVETKTTTETTAVAVTTAKAVAREVPSFIQATGSLSADETSDVAPQTSGQVVATPVGVGAFVRQGSVIARLNDRDARLRLRQAQAGV